jgi:hypothetical protein
MERGAPNGIRIHVGSLKGCCPGPLDDGGALFKYIKDKKCGQTIS